MADNSSAATCRLCMEQTRGMGVDLFKQRDGVIYAGEIGKIMNIELRVDPRKARVMCTVCFHLIKQLIRLRDLVVKNESCFYSTEESSRKNAPDPEPEATTSLRGQTIDESETFTDNHENPGMTPDRPSSTESISSPLIEVELEELSYIELEDNIDEDFLIEYDLNDASLDEEPIEIQVPTLVPETRAIPDTDSEWEPPTDDPGPVEPKLLVTKTSLPAQRQLLRHLRDTAPPPSLAVTLQMERLMLEMGVLMCKRCDTNCNGLDELREHVKEHHDSERYLICCSQPIRLPLTRLHDHIRWHLDKDAFKCKDCERTFTESSLLQLHIHGHHSEKPVQRTRAYSAGFRKLDPPLERYMADQGLLICQVCGKNCGNLIDLRNHVKANHRYHKYLLCCGRSVLLPTQLLYDHIQWHVHKKGYKGKDCEQILANEEEHLGRVMAEMGLFQCKVCAKDCSNYDLLRHHVHRVHPDSENYEICCKRSLKLPLPRLYDHILWHLDKDTFNCEDCGRQHMDSSALRHHIIHHHSDKPRQFVCEFCGADFRNKRYLSSHIKRHKNSQKMSSCKYCGIVIQEVTMTSHIKQFHEVEVNCLCHLCGKGFESGGRLKVHLKDHQGNRYTKKNRIRRKAKAQVFDESYFK